MSLENSKVYFNEGPITISLPSLSWTFVPCFIGLWSIYNNALILPSWAFIRMHLEIFNPLSQKWAYNVFITFRLFIFIHHFTFCFFEIALQVEYIVAFLSKSMKFSSFWVQAYNKETQDQGSSYWLCRILMLGPQHTCYHRPKVLFSKRAFSTWAYDSNQAMVL